MRHINVKKWWLGLFLLLVCAMPAIAETDPSITVEPSVTATFFDSDLRESIKEVSLQTGVPILMDENVNGIITMEMKDIPLSKALRMMTIGFGLATRKVDDFYIVGLPDPKNPAFVGLCESTVYYFQNISAQSARALIPTFYEPYVKFDSVKDCAVIIAPPDLMNQIVEDLKKIDGQRRQIKIKALVSEIKTEVLKKWGMNILNFDFTNSGSGWKSAGLDIPNGEISISEQGDFGSLTATIKALVNEKKATINADPVLVVTEGKSGDLFVGEKHTLILYSQGTNSSSSSTENVEAGTTLKVTPKIVGNQIELTITQKTSNFYDSTTDEITVYSREFNSVVRFLPGQTVMVAGMTEKKTQNNVNKVPVLGDIPLIGLLFKQKSDSKGDSQLLIFLTAEVVKDV